MARYFFHLRDHVNSVLDTEGIELAGHADVIAQSLWEARSILSHDIRQGRIDLDQRIEVLDDSGVTVHVLAFADAVEIAGYKPPAA